MGKVRKRWTYEQINLAISAIRGGESVRSVSRRTGIAKTTLLDKLTGRVPMNKSCGPATVLTLEEESVIVGQIVHLNNRGFPITKKQLINHVESFVKSLNRETPFTNGRPGRHWCDGFLRRHPEILNLITRSLALSKYSITAEQIKDWFQAVKLQLEAITMKTLDGSRIFNLDESSFFLCPQDNNFYTRKRYKPMNNIQNDEKERLTVVFTINAIGMMVPPMVLFKYKRIPYSITQTAPSDWIIEKSNTGWMTAETCFEYITTVFHPWLTNNNIQRPVVLYVDGNSLNVTYPLAQFCAENEIELISLLPNSTHILQPLNIALFEPLQEICRKRISDFCTEKQKKAIRKEDFCILLKSVIDSLDLHNIMYNGFRETGLYPFTPDVINFNQLFQDSVQSDEIMNIEEDKKIAKVVLEFTEKIIDSRVLEEFKTAEQNDTWTGEPRHESLFYYWLTALRLSKLK